MADNSHGAGESCLNYVQHVWVEDMLLMKGCGLTARNGFREQLPESARLHRLRVVSHVSGVETVTVRKSVIEPDGEIVFRRHFLRCKSENSGIAGPLQLTVGRWVESRQEGWMLGGVKTDKIVD